MPFLLLSNKKIYIYYGGGGGGGEKENKKERERSSIHCPNCSKTNFCSETTLSFQLRGKDKLNLESLSATCWQ